MSRQKENHMLADSCRAVLFGRYFRVQPCLLLTCHFAASRSLNIKVGFIHVPYLPEQAVEKDAAPSMSRERVVAALEAAVRVVAEAF